MLRPDRWSGLMRRRRWRLRLCGTCHGARRGTGFCSGSVARPPPGCDRRRRDGAIFYHGLRQQACRRRPDQRSRPRARPHCGTSAWPRQSVAITAPGLRQRRPIAFGAIRRHGLPHGHQHAGASPARECHARPLDAAPRRQAFSPAGQPAAAADVAQEDGGRRYRVLRSSPSPALEIAPMRSTSPDWSPRGVRPSSAPAWRERERRCGSSMTAGR